MSFEKKKIGRRLLSAAFVAGAIAIPSMTGGCSLIMGDLGATQCDSDLACWNNPAFSATDTNGQHQYTCQRGICAPVVGVISNTPQASTACVSTQKCFEDHGNQPWICQRPGVDPCVRVESEDCTKVERKAANGTVEFTTPGYAGALAEDSVLIGTITPLTYTPADKPNQRLPLAFMQDALAAVDMGIAEWRTQMQGIAYGDASRPVFAVHCNSNFDVFGEVPKRAARHLIEVLKVKGLIVGADEELAAIAPMIAEAKIPTVCVECEKEVPAAVQGLAVRVKPSATAQAPLAVDWTKRLETKIRSERSLPAATNVKALLVWQENGAPQIYGTLLASTIELNAKKATENDAQSFKQLKIGDGLTRTVDMHVIAQTEIVPFLPDIVVLTGGFRTITETIYETESQWPANKPRPEYVLDSVAANQATIDAVLTFAADRDDLRKRITGTKLVTRAANMNVFKAAFAKPADDIWTGYEGLYALSYAMSAQATTPGFDGNFTGAGFTRLVDGAPSPFHAAAIPAAVSELRAGRAVDVDGISTSLDWDLATGEVKSAKFSIFCVAGSAGSYKIVENAGITYDAKTNTTTGTFACP